MPKNPDPKCKICSALSDAEAKQLHDAAQGGDGCWAGDPCHKLRYYYANQETINAQRRENYKRKKLAKQQVGIEHLRAQGNDLSTSDLLRAWIPQAAPVLPPERVYVQLLWYRETPKDRLHAIGALLLLGDQTIAFSGPYHCRGLAPKDVTDYLIPSMVRALNQVLNENFPEYQTYRIGRLHDEGDERHPALCPLCTGRPMR